MKLPWEITAIYSEVLKQAGHQSDDEEDEDDIEAHEASIQRLKEADEATREMTREEYQHYSECRQASFTYRKSTPELYSFYHKTDIDGFVSKQNASANSSTSRQLWI